MRTQLCDALGMEFPIFAFSHCRDVVAAVTNAGGIGVFGALGSTPSQLDEELRWIDDQVKGRPYGVDIVLPARSLEDDHPDTAELAAMIPPGHRAFVAELLADHGVRLAADAPGGGRVSSKAAELELVDVVLDHRSRLLVNALGPMPADVVDRCHDAGLLVGALVGTARHAEKQVANGVDVIVAQGTEAAGHTGEISTMVLVPQVVDAVAPTPVLAAGGIACGRQVAAALALGADGVWTGSLWLTVQEADTPPALKEKILAATSLQTVRTRSVTGKPNRFLRSAWTDAWERPDAPAPLPWPLQMMLTTGAISRIMQVQNAELITTSVGQGVGLVNEGRTARHVVLDLVEEFLGSASRVASMLEESATG
jgi:NAD(P)H-dependent flavin oxidoreductase YrpB (nitropropane dioxygenase family)